jgi:hypothetical protein
MVRSALIIIVSICGLVMTSHASKRKKPPKSFVCKVDSIIQFGMQEMVGKGIDSLMIFKYDYDNGRAKNPITYFLWFNQGVSFIWHIEGCQTITHDSTYTNDLSCLFNFYTSNHIDTAKGPIKSNIRQSHDMGYNITVYLNGQLRHFNVRDYQRDDRFYSGAFQEDRPIDLRVRLTNMFEEIVK